MTEHPGADVFIIFLNPEVFEQIGEEAGFDWRVLNYVPVHLPTEQVKLGFVAADSLAACASPVRQPAPAPLPPAPPATAPVAAPAASPLLPRRHGAAVDFAVPRALRCGNVDDAGDPDFEPEPECEAAVQPKLKCLKTPGCARLCAPSRRHPEGRHGGYCRVGNLAVGVIKRGRAKWLASPPKVIETGPRVRAPPSGHMN